MKKCGNLYWSVRREVWEHRSVYMAPLIVAAVVLVGFAIHVSGLKRNHAAAMPYSMAASAILFTSFVVAVFYCLDALNGERRDRSILFWKSMPVSDLTTVTAKAIVAAAVLPLIAFGVALATQVVMMLVSAAVLSTTGTNAVMPWEKFPLPRQSIVMAYGLAVHVLWYAPIYGWLLLVSAWARRAVFLWAFLPLVAISVMEKIALGTAWFASVMQYRFVGAMIEAFAVDAFKNPVAQLSELEPVKFLSTPGLWLGLAFAAACFAAAVRLRRYRDPI
ncbi:MAG: ABC transporter permease [Burkholderiales bacterium]|nr:ABC transporter permease [Burkholderiales bacterium]